MHTLSNLALLLPLALWSGSAFFFTVVAAPRLFATVERPVFAAVVNTLFPVYFVLGAVLLAISALTAVARAWRERSRSRWLTAGFISLAWLGMAAAVTIIEPQIAAARALAGTAEGDALFRRSHGLSMMVNAAAMISALLAWITIAYERSARARRETTEPARRPEPIAARGES